MGYLIENTIINKATINIPEVDVQIMDSATPYTLIQGNNVNTILPVACYISIGPNQTTPYTGATHIHLTTRNNYGVGDLCATYAFNASGTNSLIAGEAVYAMLCNFQASPNRYGGINSIKNLEIFFDAPVTGNGDMIVNLIYFTL